MQGYQQSQSSQQMNPQQSHQYQQGYQYHQQQSQTQPSQVSKFYNKAPEQTLNTENSSVYLTLLGLAESFQQAAKYGLCIHCLESIFVVLKQDKQMPSFHFQLKVRFNLCRLYLRHTLGTNIALNTHLEKSVFNLLIF